jgi:G:T-mismatch repair DNA endonuclease (very short patch repair protein)
MLFPKQKKKKTENAVDELIRRAVHILGIRHRVESQVSIGSPESQVSTRSAYVLSACNFTMFSTRG